MRLPLPALMLLSLALLPALAPEAEAIACANPPPPGPGVVNATLYFARKTVADNCNNTLWYGCFLITTALGPGNCPA